MLGNCQTLDYIHSRGFRSAGTENRVSSKLTNIAHIIIKYATASTRDVRGMIHTAVAIDHRVIGIK